MRGVFPAVFSVNLIVRTIPKLTAEHIGRASAISNVAYRK